MLITRTSIINFLSISKVFKLWALIVGVFWWANSLSIAMDNADGQFLSWPDSGQETCFDGYGEIRCPSKGDPFYGQDAQFQRNPQSYTKLGYGGVELPDNATLNDGWLMTRDNVTGLVWEIKAVDGSRRDHHMAYGWCSAIQDVPIGAPPRCDNATEEIEEYIRYLNDGAFGGFSDWRIPTIEELSTLINMGIAAEGPTLARSYFPNTVPSSYWSDSVCVGFYYYNWRVDFEMGTVYPYYNFTRAFVRAVRGPRWSASSLRFIDNLDGTITDRATGLMWQRCPMGMNYEPETNSCNGTPSTYDWEEALSAVYELNWAGYMDWRLPDRNELQSIVDYARVHPAIDEAAFPNTPMGEQGPLYWTSTTYLSEKSSAWAVDFDWGSVYWLSKMEHGYVRAVRVPNMPMFGDADGNGFIDWADLWALKWLLSGGGYLEVFDFDGDGLITDGDIEAFIMYFGGRRP